MTTIEHEAIADVLKVLDYVAQGNTPTTACDDMGLSYITFCRLTSIHGQLRAMREEAEDRCYDVLADRLLHIHENVTDPKMANIVSSNTKWLLERRRSKAYGAKSTLEVNLTADREVLDALQNAKARAHGKVMIEAKTDDLIDLTMIAGVARVVSGADWDEQAYQRELAEIS